MTPPTNQNSSPLLSTEESSPTKSGSNTNNTNLDEIFMTDPLESLCSCPVDKMTREQLLEYVVKLRNYRQTHQTFKADVESLEKTSKTKREVVKKVVDLSGLAELGL